MLECRVSGYIENRGKTVCQRPIQKLILYEINHELYEMTMNSMR